MNYYSVIGLDKEPFSTSPDPAFFYESRQHHSVLVKAMIEIRLKRGLSVIFGDVGTGKTTLSRKLFQMLKEREDIIFGMILDPVFETEELFLEALLRTFKIQYTGGNNILDYKDAVKKFLYEKGVSENKTVVLLIDEGQKLNDASIEVLRSLLNYETNEFKLLQLVLLGQLELLPRLKRIQNVWDRISMKYIINPLNENETREMIMFRLKQAGYRFPKALFSDEAISEIYRYTRGCPRKVALICHEAVCQLVARSDAFMDVPLVREIIDNDCNVKEAVADA